MSNRCVLYMSVIQVMQLNQIDAVIRSVLAASGITILPSVATQLYIATSHTSNVAQATPTLLRVERTFVQQLVTECPTHNNMICYSI